MSEMSPESFYERDAAHINSSKKHRKELVDIIRFALKDKPTPTDNILTEIQPILDDCGNLPKDGRVDKTYIQYMCTNYLKPEKIVWPAPVFLCWLCIFREDIARRFYASVDLPFRRFPHPVGAWAEKRRAAAKSRGAPKSIDVTDLGPIISPRLSTRDEKFLRHAGSTEISRILFPHPNGICNADISPCGKFLVTAGKKKRNSSAQVFIWRLDDISQSDRSFSIADSIGSNVSSVTFSPDSKYVLWSEKNIARISHAHTLMDPIFELNHQGPISYCCFSPTKSQIATSSHDKTACVWDSKNGKKLKTMRPKIKGKHYGINSVNFSPDGERLVLAIATGLISIWDIKTETEISTFRSENNFWLCGATYSKDGKRILSAGPDEGSAHIWDVETQKAIILGGDDAHEDMIWFAEFSPDEELVVTASDDHFAFIWGVKSRSILMRLPHPDKLWKARFSPDGNHVLTACHDGCAYLWKIK